MSKENLGEMVKVLSEGGFLKDDELMIIVRVGVSRMTGEDERALFHPIGILNRDMHVGEPVYSKDFKKENYVEAIPKN